VNYTGNGMTCTGINGCATNNGGCDTHAQCTSTGANTVSCACNPNYTGNGTTCTAVNSCNTNNGGCDAHAMCTMTGPGTNSCACNTGYSGSGTVCTAINVCVTNNGGCDPNATCTMTGPGTKSCACKTGYSGNGTTCTAINNCATSNGGCATGQTCTMTGPGTNTCGACPSGMGVCGGACVADVYYQDLDGDGYGNPNVSVTTCTQPAGYVTKSGDCCDADLNAFPGQTAYFTTPTACGSSTQSTVPYDYNCNGVDDLQSNGPTDCNWSCQVNSTQTGCNVVGLAADCCAALGFSGAGCNPAANVSIHNILPGACGQTWSFFAGGCSLVTSTDCVVAGSQTPPMGTQACH
jgi:hypothetical protein